MRYLLFAQLLLLAACDQGQKVMPFEDNISTAYTLCKSPDLPGGVSLQVQLDTTRNEQLQLKLLVKNNSGSALIINPAEATLHTQDSRRESPLMDNWEAGRISSGEERQYTWSYKPVNDLFLYQYSNLHGPWLQNYQLPLSFIEGMKDTLFFCFPEEAYLSYSKAAERTKPVLYKPSQETIAPEAVKRQEKYLREISGTVENADAGSVYFSEQEFFSAGVNLRHALYQKGDSLYLRLQLINHTPQLLQLNPAAVTITAKQQEHRPVHITGPPLANRDNYQVRKGDRLALTLIYKAPAADNLLVSLAGIQLMQAKKSLFGDSFSFIRQ